MISIIFIIFFENRNKIEVGKSGVVFLFVILLCICMLGCVFNRGIFVCFVYECFNFWLV